MLRPLLALLLLLPLPALADAVRVSLEPRAKAGRGLPALLVHVEEPIAGFEVRLRRSDGQALNVKGGGPPGVVRRLELEQPEGAFHWEGELVVRFRNAEEGSLPLSFDTELVGELRLEVREQDVDVEGRRLVFRLNRPAQKAHLVVQLDTGQVVHDATVDLKGAAPGTPLALSWPAPRAQGRVLKLALRAWDTADFFTGVELFPWQVDIPHEEVQFPTGSSAIPPAERPKLDRSLALVRDAVARYGRWAALKLYVVGHTDTVGRPEDNQALSLARARSIAAYLRGKGLRLPLFYDGYGEGTPAVATPDETAEAANRRATYILSVEEPSLPAPPFPPRWRKL